MPYKAGGGGEVYEAIGHRLESILGRQQACYDNTQRTNEDWVIIKLALQDVIVQ